MRQQSWPLLLCDILTRQRFGEHLGTLTLFWRSSLSAEICLAFLSLLCQKQIIHSLPSSPFLTALPISESNCSIPGSTSPRRLLLWQKRWGCSQAPFHIICTPLPAGRRMGCETWWHHPLNGVPALSRSRSGSLMARCHPCCLPRDPCKVSGHLLQNLARQCWGGKGSSCFKNVL